MSDCSIEVDTSVDTVEVLPNDTISIKQNTLTVNLPSILGEVTVHPRNYTLVGDDVYTIKKASSLEPWFEDQINGLINNGPLAGDVQDLDNRFVNFEDGITKEIGYLKDADNRLAYDLNVIKVSNDQNTAGIQHLDIVKVTGDEASAISSATIGAWQNGAGGAWFDSKVSTVSNVAYSAAKSASTLTASLESQQKQLALIVGDIDVLEKQVDGKVETWFGHQDVVDSNGDIIPAAEPYSLWLAAGTVDIHTGDTFVKTETNPVTGNEDLIGSWTFVNDSANNSYKWLLRTDDTANKALQDAANAQATADGKINTYYQAFPPDQVTDPTMGEGDLWLDSDDNNKMYRYQGSPLKWTEVQDKSISASVRRLDEATVDVDGVATAKSSLVVNADGNISGFRATATNDPNDPGSAFRIFADKFQISNGASSGAVPFEIDTTTSKIKFTGAVTFGSVNTSELNNDAGWTDDQLAQQAQYYASANAIDIVEANNQIATTNAIANDALTLGNSNEADIYRVGQDVDLVNGRVDTQQVQITNLESQVDGVVETFFSLNSPTIDSTTSKPDPTKKPYSDWIASSDLRPQHSGDTVVHYREVDDGNGGTVKEYITDYRFAKVETPNEDTDAQGYGFFAIANSKADEAYQLALKSGISADGKVNTYYKSINTPPADVDAPEDSNGVKALGVGDIWISSEDNIIHRYSSAKVWVPIPASKDLVIGTINGTTNTTTIDGRHITTGTINADRFMGDSIWVNGSLSSGDFSTIGGDGFRLKTNAAGTSTDPTIYGAYIRGGHIQGTTIEASTVLFRDLKLLNDAGKNTATYASTRVGPLHAYASTSSSINRAVSNNTRISISGGDPFTYDSGGGVYKSADGYIHLTSFASGSASSHTFNVKFGSISLSKSSFGGDPYNIYYFTANGFKFCYSFTTFYSQSFVSIGVFRENSVISGTGSDPLFMGMGTVNSIIESSLALAEIRNI